MKHMRTYKILHTTFLFSGCFLALALMGPFIANAETSAVSAVDEISVDPSAENTAAPDVPSTEVPVTADTITAPSETELSTPALPEADNVTTQGTNVMGDAGVNEKHSGTYYRSDALVPSADVSGPRKVDPAVEPGQSLVVVKRTGTALSTEAQYIAATRALKLGRYAAAMEMFENLYAKNHKDPRIIMGLAVAQQGAGFNESAARTYEDLLKVQPNNADAIVNLMGLMREQYPSKTLAKLQELRSKYPTNPGIPAQLGLISGEMKNYDDAFKYFDVASTMDPRNPSHIYNMAIISDRAGKTRQAIQYYERALQMDASYGSNANTLPRDEIYDRLVVLRRKV